MILNGFSNPILDQYQKVLKKNQIEIAGIEFLQDAQGQLYTYDINTNTNYNSVAESLSELKGMKAVADFLKRELEKDGSGEESNRTDPESNSTSED